MQVLDFVKNYPGGVPMTMAEVAYAKGYDNAPTVENPGQADADHDGIGDAIDGASLGFPTETTLSRNEAGTLSATLTNGAGDPIAGQDVTFAFDADGDGTDETYTAATGAAGVANATVTATRPVGSASYSASWDGLRATADGSAGVTVADATSLNLDAANPTSGQVTDSVTVGATLIDSDGAPLAGRTVTLSIGSASAAGTTDASGHASATLVLPGPAGPETLTASFAGAGFHGPSSASSPFTIAKEDATLTMPDAVGKPPSPVVALATLRESDGAPLAGKEVTFLVQDRVRSQLVYTAIGTAVTDGDGVASRTIPVRYVSKVKRPIRATFSGDESFLGATADAFAYRP